MTSETSPPKKIERSVRIIPGGKPHPGSRWLDEHIAELPIGEWSASDGERLVAHSPSIYDLYEQLERDEVPMLAVAIMYNSKEATV
jgi:hypothetical protein